MKILKNCIFPDDCECAKRGYNLEREDCAIPNVDAAAKTFGMKLNHGILKSRPLPKPVALRGGGTGIMLIVSDDFAQDVFDAIKMSGSSKICKLSKDDIERIL